VSNKHIVNELQVIGAGFGRSGTMSLREALQTLGYGPCYHMQVTLTHYSHMKFWIRAKAGDPVDYREFFRHYKATVDWPACEFYKELMTAFPGAKVLLNVRVRIPRHVGPRFHVMPGRYSTACRATVPR
jgi:hypothetical protein